MGGQQGFFSTLRRQHRMVTACRKCSKYEGIIGFKNLQNIVSERFVAVTLSVRRFVIQLDVGLSTYTSTVYNVFSIFIL